MQFPVIGLWCINVHRLSIHHGASYFIPQYFNFRGFFSFLQRQRTKAPALRSQLQLCCVAKRQHAKNKPLGPTLKKHFCLYISRNSMVSFTSDHLLMLLCQKTWSTMYKNSHLKMLNCINFKNC